MPAAAVWVVVAVTDSSELDLFGDTLPTTASQQRGTGTRRNGRGRAVNDMAGVEEVLRQAVDAGGFALAGVAGRVYRVVDEAELHPVPARVADLVGQLLDAGWLTVGGSHRYRWRNRREGCGYAVLVPRRTRDTLARWTALRAPCAWGRADRKGR